MKKLIALTVATLTLATGAITVSAANQHFTTENGGYVIIDDRTRGDNYEIVDGGQGQWHYGTSLGFAGKNCYSNLVHDSQRHQTTAIIGDKRNDSSVVGPMKESRASVSSFDLECVGEAYWSTIG